MRRSGCGIAALGTAALALLGLDPKERSGFLSKGSRTKVGLVLALAHEPDAARLNARGVPTATHNFAQTLAGLRHRKSGDPQWSLERFYLELVK